MWGYDDSWLVLLFICAYSEAHLWLTRGTPVIEKILAADGVEPVIHFNLHHQFHVPVSTQYTLNLMILLVR